MSEFTKRLNIPLTQECWHELGRTLGAQTWPGKSPKSHTLQEQLLQQQEYIKQLEAQLAAKK